MKSPIHIALLLYFLPITLKAQVTDGPRSASTASNIALTGSASSWTDPSNSLVSDNQYATASFPVNGDYSDHLQVTDFGFNLPASSVILGILVEVEHYGDRVKDNQIRIVKGGTIGSSDRSLTNNWPNSDTGSYFQYGGSTDLWGEAWTESDINATNFGFAISARRVGGGPSTATALVDHIRITVYYDTALPVGMLHFEAQKQERTIHLNWATAWEKGNSHFEVQRTSFDLDFETIGFVPGSNDSESEIHYQFTDSSPLEGRSFYRLVQHDFNGNFSISELVAADMEKEPQKYSLNPTLVEQSITLTLTDCSPADHVLIIVNASGLKLNPIYPTKPETLINQSYFKKPGIYQYILFYKGKKVMSGKVIKP